MTPKAPAPGNARTVNLNQIIGWARQACGEEEE